MIQKSVLIGCKEGSWIPCFGLQNIRLDIIADPDARIKVELKGADEVEFTTTHCPGQTIMILPEARFIKASVVEGSYENILVRLSAEKKSALQTA